MLWISHHSEEELQILPAYLLVGWEDTFFQSTGHNLALGEQDTD